MATSRYTVKIVKETFEEYKDRVCNDLWYRMPYSRYWYFGDDIDKYHKFWKENWPYQYAFRSKLNDHWSRYRACVKGIKDFIYFQMFPQNTWVTSRIRRSWMDPMV